MSFIHLILNHFCVRMMDVPRKTPIFVGRMTKIVSFFLCGLVVALGLQAQPLSLESGRDIRISGTTGMRPVVSSALAMLQDDVGQVLGSRVKAVRSAKKADIVCTTDETLPREGFRLTVRKGQLHVTGADAHGLAYGLLEVSRLLGVSPWSWWADCTPRRLTVFTLDEGFTTQQSPAVKFRGIFINDEDWGMMPWASNREPRTDDPSRDDASNLTTRVKRRGLIGPKTNERIFQLLLRLRGNYFWPAMHECTEPFFTVPGNREMAARYGIYMGGSHCEPMACTPATEWAMRGQGNYDYVNNAEAVKTFWQERLNQVKDQEIVYTIGMRGVHDGSMQGVKTREEKLHWLQRVIDDQRQMLSAALQRPADQIPQVFVPYKEVLQIYEDGLRVPDDVTLMWTDDNYGYIRHFPDSAEAARRGGNGIYYHVSYWGRPHDYLWLSTTSPQLLRQQMTEAYRHGVRDIWVLNVGDLKPAEYQTELWMDMAWHGIDAYRLTGESPEGHLHDFLSREFGAPMARQLAPILQEHYRLAYIRKPEFMAGTRTEEADRKYWNTPHLIDGWTQTDVAQRVAAYQRLSDQVERLWAQVPADRRDAFFQLVKYPVQGAAQMSFKYLCPEVSAAAHDSIQALTALYNHGFANSGKWDGIMSTHPRNLPVFSRLDTILTYPAPSQRYALPLPMAAEGVTAIDGLGYDGTALAFQQGRSIRLIVPEIAAPIDTLTLEVRLLPSLPIAGDRIAFSLAADGGTPVEVAYQTYDRSEEWKRNVLRNQAIRTVRLPLAKAASHTVTFTAITPGVVLDQLLVVP